MLTGWESRAEDYRHFKEKRKRKKTKRIDIALFSGLLQQRANKLTDGMSGVGGETLAFLIRRDLTSHYQNKEFWTWLLQEISCTSFVYASAENVIL